MKMHESNCDTILFDNISGLRLKRASFFLMEDDSGNVENGCGFPGMF